MRLIDADELLTHIEDFGEGQSRLDLIDPYYVRNAPTVYASKAEDCISRNLAIQRMKQNVEVVEKDVADLRKYGCEFTNEQFEKKLIERCIWTLRAIPSVYPEGDKPSEGWIPVSERLPDTEDEVLCWYEYYHWSKEKILPGYGIGQYIGGDWFGMVSIGRDVRVIAWQPLPEPYKEEQIDGNSEGV